MTDVRLTATNPEDSSVVPVACNAKGELLLEEIPAFDGNVDGDLTVSGRATIAGDVGIGGGSTFGSIPDYFAHQLNIYEEGIGPVTGISFGANASSNYIYAQNGASSIDLAPEYAAGIRVGSFSGDFPNRVARFSPNGLEIGGTLEEDDAVIKGNIILRESGSAEFSSDVVVGSRNKKWMLVEQSGLCHMVEQLSASTADLVDPANAVEYPPLRDVFNELDLVEKALGEVMERLRMKPPAGWEVWDGSSEDS